MNKKWGLVLLTSLIALSTALTGCGGKKEENTADKEAGKETNQEIVFPLEQPVDLTMFTVKHPQVKKEYGEMQFFKNMFDKTGVNVNWNLASTADGQEQMNLLFASDDLPDAFFGPYLMSTSDIVRYGTDGQIVPLEEMINEKLTPNIVELFEKRPEYKAYVTAPDGHIYSIPMISETVENTIPDAMFINQKWLDKLGLKMPTTTDEFYEVLKAFKTGDPNGNGSADEIPFSVMNMKNAIQGPLSMAAAFGKSWPNGNANFFRVENGKITFAPTLEENRDFLSYMNKLYKEGLIDQEIFTHDASVYTAKLNSNPSSVGAFIMWNASALPPETRNDYVIVPPLKGPGGETGWNRQEPNNAPHGFSITKENKHPEFTMKWFDEIYETDTSLEATFGPFGINLEKVEGGYTVVPSDDPGFRYSESAGAQAPGAVLAETFATSVPNPDAAPDRKMEYVELLKPYTDPEIFPRNLMMSLEDADLSKQWGIDVIAENAYMDQAIAKIVTGKDPEGEWKKMVGQFNKYGLEEYTAMMQRNYDSYISSGGGK